MNHVSSIYTSKANLTKLIPWTTPTKNDGTCIVTTTLVASDPTAEIRVEFDASVVHLSGAWAIVASLFVDDELYARRTAAVTPVGTGYIMPLALRYSFVPGDTEPHTYRIHVGSTGGIVRLNAIDSGESFGDTMASTLLVQEL